MKNLYCVLAIKFPEGNYRDPNFFYEILKIYGALSNHSVYWKNILMRLILKHFVLCDTFQKLCRVIHFYCSNYLPLRSLCIITVIRCSVLSRIVSVRYFPFTYVAGAVVVVFYSHPHRTQMCASIPKTLLLFLSCHFTCE